MNKRKRLSDGDCEVVMKAMKTADQDTPTKAARPKLALRIVTEIAHLADEDETSGFGQDSSSTDSDDEDSLFDEPQPRLPTPEVLEIRSILTSNTTDDPALGSEPVLCPSQRVVARRTAPAIPGLFFDPTILLPEDLAEEIMWNCIRTYFQTGASNQVMLFERPAPAGPPPSPSTASPDPSTDSAPSLRLPPYLSDLLSRLQDLLRPLVPPATHDILFSPSPASHSGPPRARQAIINLYLPGEGITPHVDLLSRYSDGIIGVSLGSGCAMEFARADAPPAPSAVLEPISGSHADALPPAASPGLGPISGADADRCALYLPKGSVVVMTDAARYDWTHGIEDRLDDWVEDEPGSARGVRLGRDVRLSVTFRWMLPGAEVVGSAVPL